MTKKQQLNFDQDTDFKDCNYEQLKQIMITCQNCPLSEQRTHVVCGQGIIPNDLMIIGEGPGEQEDLTGIPFTGRSGQLLTKILHSAKINRETDTFITNIVKCRPPKNRNPLKKEINACKPYLIRQIQLIKPKIICLLGSPSLKTILEESLPITKVRGKWYEATVNYMKDPLLIIPLFHPSYLLRNGSKKEHTPYWNTLEDIKKIKKKLTS